MMRLQGHSDMGGHRRGLSGSSKWAKRVTYDPPTWQTPKLASSISHVFGKSDDVTMVEIFGAGAKNSHIRK